MNQFLLIGLIAIVVLILFLVIIGYRVKEDGSPLESQGELIEVSYTCLLIPRSPSHQLKGDLGDHLPSILQKICASYGWRLEFTTIHPDYLQWALSVPLSTSPDQFMQTIRYETSEFIFSNFGDIQREDSSIDFWAPGYLVVLGTRPYQNEMIEKFVYQNRLKFAGVAAGLAGDSSTDAPPPDVKKKKQKGE